MNDQDKNLWQRETFYHLGMSKREFVQRALLDFMAAQPHTRSNILLEVDDMSDDQLTYRNQIDKLIEDAVKLYNIIQNHDM